MIIRQADVKLLFHGGGHLLGRLGLLDHLLFGGHGLLRGLSLLGTHLLWAHFFGGRSHLLLHGLLGLSSFGGLLHWLLLHRWLSLSHTETATGSSTFHLFQHSTGHSSLQTHAQVGVDHFGVFSEFIVLHDVLEYHGFAAPSTFLHGLETGADHSHVSWMIRHRFGLLGPAHGLLFGHRLLGRGRNWHRHRFGHHSLSC